MTPTLPVLWNRLILTCTGNGIHGCETLFTVMGPGCESVSRVQTANFELVTGLEGRANRHLSRNSQRKLRLWRTAFGSKGIESIGKYEGYRPLVVEIVKFFQTGTVRSLPKKPLKSMPSWKQPTKASVRDLSGPHCGCHRQSTGRGRSKSRSRAECRFEVVWCEVAESFFCSLLIV